MKFSLVDPLSEGFPIMILFERNRKHLKGLPFGAVLQSLPLAWLQLIHWFISYVVMLPAVQCTILRNQCQPADILARRVRDSKSMPIAFARAGTSGGAAGVEKQVLVEWMRRNQDLHPPPATGTATRLPSA